MAQAKGILGFVGAALFGSATPTDDIDGYNSGDNTNPVSDPLVIPQKPQADFQYHFNPQRLPRNPGPAYLAPLLQFQEYPRTVVEGNGGIHYTRPFEAFQPNFETTSLQPVISGTSGDMHGQIFYQPLMDTSGQ